MADRVVTYEPVGLAKSMLHVYIGELELAFLEHGTSGVWSFTVPDTHGYEQHISASELRAIADKLDELNGVHRG
jgi:hypothetical protein